MQQKNTSANEAVTEKRASNSEITTELKVEILLREYDALRNEISARIGTRWNLAGIGFAVLAIVITQKELPLVRTVIGIAMVIAVLVFLWYRSWLMIKRAARRVVEIEDEINSMAGEYLLRWETRFDGGLAKRPMF